MKTQEQMHLFDELPDGVVFVKDGTIEWANQAFWELLGLTRNSIPHKAPISEYLPEARTHLFSPPGLNHVKIAVLETYLQCPNSTSIPVEIHLKENTHQLLVSDIRIRHGTLEQSASRDRSIPFCCCRSGCSPRHLFWRSISEFLWSDGKNTANPSH